jgi:hypothetical protein
MNDNLIYREHFTQCGIGIAFIANAIKELENNNQIVKRSIKKNTHLQFLIYHNKYQ